MSCTPAARESDGLTAWAEDNQEHLLGGILVYRAGWLDFYPKSRVFKAE